MAEGYEFEEFADMAVEELRSFIDTEQQIVTEEHNLVDKLYSWDYIFQHLDERLPKNSKLHKLTSEISVSLIEIRELVRTGELQGLRIYHEEKALLDVLEKDVEHKSWRAVKQDTEWEEDIEKQAVRLHKDELKALHSGFISLMRLMKSKINPALKDLTVSNEKQKFKITEEYYFLQIYKFTRAYERIFRHLWRKEKTLLRKLKKIV